MRDVHAPCSFHVVSVILFFLWTGCKGPVVHDPVSNAPTAKEGSSAETLSTDHDARTNYSSLAGHDAGVVAQEAGTLPDRPRVVAEPDGTSLNKISCTPFTTEDTSNTATQQGSTSSDRPRVVAEPDGTSLNEIACMLFAPGGESNTAHQQGSTSSDRPRVVAEPDETSLNEIACMLFAPGGESNTATQQGSTSSDRPRVVAEPDGASLNEISCILFTPGGEPHTAHQQGSTSSDRPRVVSGSTLGETDAMAQRFGMPIDQFVSITRNLELNMKETNEPRLGESFDSTESHRLNTAEHGRVETLPLDVLGKEIQQDIRKVTQEIESKNYD